MARRFTSRAEQMRHHRKCFEAALEWGCTPIEAERRLDLMELRERARARCKRRGVVASAPASGADRQSTGRSEFERFDAAWMMRD